MRLSSLFILVLLAASAPTAHADLRDRRPDIRAAFDAAEAGRLDLAQAAAYADHPLFAWLQATVLRRNLDAADPAQVQAILLRGGDQPAARWLREAWLGNRVKNKDWPGFRAAYRGSDDKGLRCNDLVARLDAGPPDARWVTDAQALWLTGSSLPDACDGPFARLSAIGKLGDELRWQRVDLAIADGQSGLLRSIAKAMAPADAALLASYAAYLDAPTDPAPSSWPATARSREVAAAGLARLAKRDPDRATVLVQKVAPALGLDDRQRGRVLYEAALWTVASYSPGSADRLNAVPEAAYDERLHEWRVREAISRGDDAAALAGIEKMGVAQRSDPRWQYFEARLRERLGQLAQARALYARAAASPAFHGWLAADRIKQPYSLCALEPVADAALTARIAADPGIVRALELFAIDRPGPAAREWTSAIKPMTDNERRLAVRRAIGEGWFDRSVFAMNVSPDDLRYYALRFPLHHEADIRAQSKINSLDPAWVAAQTRAESAFMPRARSSADARGLMQLLPGTGALTASRIGTTWTGGDSLYDPTTNITLGTAYLRQMLDRFGGRPYLAIAAYNAGPAPVDRWTAARPTMDADFFVEAIPYKETREYVARVLAFSVVYDWRLNGNAASLGDRLVGRFDADPRQRRAFTCPVTPAIASTTP
jgi:soluble lytic murein transglycosylase